MSSRPVLHRLWERRLTALKKHLPAALEGDVRAVHQARVASRRLREVLPVIGLSIPPQPLRRARRAARLVTQALGPVRELDVSLVLLGELAKAHPSHLRAVLATRARLDDEREARRRLMLRELSGPKQARIIARLEDVGWLAEPPSFQWRHLLAERTGTRAAELASAVDEAGVLYDLDRLHAVRIATKKLRYTLELAGEARAAATARLLKQLKATQDHLGHLHDLQVLKTYGAEAPHDRVERTELDDFLGVLETNCRMLHAEFLAGRDAVVAVAEVAGGHVVERLERSRQSRPTPAPPVALVDR